MCDAMLDADGRTASAHIAELDFLMEFFRGELLQPHTGRKRLSQRCGNKNTDMLTWESPKTPEKPPLLSRYQYRPAVMPTG